MAMVDVDGSCLSADSQSKSVGLVWGLAATLALSLHSSNELGELSQWLCHDDSTINIILVIIIIIIIIIVVVVVSPHGIAMPKGLYFTAVSYSFFCFLRSLNGSQPSLDTYSYMKNFVRTRFSEHLPLTG